MVDLSISDSTPFITLVPADGSGQAIPMFHTSWGWVTGTVYVNRDEAWRMSQSWFALPISGAPAPPLDMLVAAEAGYVAAHAGWAYHDGRCPAISTKGYARSFTGGWCY